MWVSDLANTNAGVFGSSSSSGGRGPVVSAGSDRTVSRNTLVNLSATVTGGRPTYSYRWSVIASPVAVIFTGQTTATPSFTPATPGVYILQCLVDDFGAKSGWDEVQITVT